ncbi:VWA domain-containing protein [Limnochorda pilosa]|uniref:VWFA domain-containing protein n=1 Tax=Limnochorda pilosa TaxID=1555112 RepID=A0A0K2SPB6_LIMPI|nr:VWA domain-containing protein [Limnochorda pilosa]BAS28983.1 hypothetical protein LIP_3156 [Limnochorda pilosa]
MGLLAPGWLALQLLAVPIILLHRRRAAPRPHLVGNLFIWRRVLVERPPRHQRLFASLLLVLQLAALSAAALALAQPVLLRPGGERQPIHVVLDGSASMMAPVPGGGDRFQAALEELAARSARFPEAAYTLLLAGGPHPRVVARDLDRAALLREARRLSPSFAPAAWEQAGSLLASLPGPPAPVWLAGDGQGGAIEIVRSALEPSGRDVGVSLLSAGEPLPNLAVTALSARPTGASLDRYAVLVEVSNASDQATRVQLSLALTSLAPGPPAEPRPVLSRELEVDARASRRLQEEISLPPDGLWVAEARIDPQDPFPLDDAAALVVLPPRPTLVYLVSARGEPWQRALRALPEVAVTWRQVLPSQPPEGYDLVIYDGLLPERLPSSASVLVPPAGAKAAEGAGAPRAAGGGAAPSGTLEGMGPATLFYGEPIPRPTSASWWQEDDPLFQFVDWSEVTLHGVHPLQARAGTTVLMDSPEGPLMLGLQDPPSLLLGFDPGQGRLASLPTFPVWVANLVRWANPQAWDRVAPALGLGEILPLPASGRLVTPGGAQVTAGPWQVTHPGVYRLVPGGTEAPSEQASWARATAPLPRGEADLTDVAPSTWVDPEPPATPGSGSLRQQTLAGGLTVVFGLLLLAELILWLQREATGGFSLGGWLRRHWPALVSRALALVLVAGAAAGAAHTVPSDLNELWVLLDRSDSVDRSLREEAWRWAGRLKAEAGERRLGVVLFGVQPALEHPPDDPARLPPTPRASVDASGTDLEAALRLAAARLHPPARLVVATDGHATRGDAGLLLERLRELGTPVDVVPLAREAPAEVAIDQLRVRPQTDPGAPYLVRVSLRAGQPTPARLVLRAAGVPVAERQVRVPAGSSAFDLTARAPDLPGVLPLEVTVEAPVDDRPENNRAEAAVRVGEPPRVVVVSGGDPVTAPLLRAQGLEPAVMRPEALPSDPSFWEALGALVLEDVPATALTQVQRRSVEHLVRDLGGGLLVVGGPQAFTSGGYQGTELERLLPVSLQLPQDLLVPRVAMVLVIDRSGSMGEHQGQRTKLDLAKQASLSLFDNLSTDDLLGILAFDTQATWVVPLNRVGSGGGVLQRLARISPSGGTNLGPALDEAITALEPVSAVVKHVLILSDGKSTPGPFLRRAREAAAASISLSTVAIGRDADRELLASLAQEGGGRHYYTDDVERLPEIFLREVRAVTAPQVLVGPHPVAVREREPFLSGAPSRFEPIERLNAASPRPEATLQLATEAGRPVLASWSYGLGRVAAFLSYPAPGWAGEWAHLPALWAQVARWLLPSPTGLHASSTLEVASGAGTLTVDLLDMEGGYVNFAPLEGTLQAPDGSTRPLELEQVAPGRYRAAFPASQPGAYLVTVRRTDQGPAAPVTTASAWVAAAPELELHTRPAPQLYELARETGGRVLNLDDDLDQVWEALAGAQTRRSLRLPLVLAGLALFLADLSLRLARIRRRQPAS